MNNKKINILKVLIPILFLSSGLIASQKQIMRSLYKDAKYMRACNIGHDSFLKNKKDEEYVTLYAYSCLKADYINRLARPIGVLRSTKEARFNSAYFSVILMQKKLLYYSMIDDFDISSLKLPSSDHILSRIFNMYIDASRIGQKPPFNFTDKKDPNLSYKLYLIKEDNIQKVVIDELYNSKLITKHKYW